MVVCTWPIGVVVVPWAKRKVSIEPGVLKVLTDIINIRQQWCIRFDGSPQHPYKSYRAERQSKNFRNELAHAWVGFVCLLQPKLLNSLPHSLREVKKNTLLVALGNWASAAWMSTSSKPVVILWTTSTNLRLFTLSPIIEKHWLSLTLTFQATSSRQEEIACHA